MMQNEKPMAIGMTTKAAAKENAIFFGSQAIGAQCLSKLCEMGEKFSAVLTFNPAPHETWGGEIEAVAKKHTIPVINTDEEKNWAKKYLELGPTRAYVIGWRRIIPSEIIKSTSGGIYALHASLLPKYAGFAPLNWVIIRGEKESGVTLFLMDAGVDTGKVVEQVKFPIEFSDDFSKVKEKAETAALKAVCDAYKKISSGKVRAAPQKLAQGSYACRRKPEHGLIDWNRSAIEIYNLVRGLAPPAPCAFTRLRLGQEISELKILSARLHAGPPSFIGKPGQVGRILKGIGVAVVTGNGSVVIEKVRLKNGQVVRADEFIKSTETEFF